ncbi:MAG: hypothetical protein M0025_07495 [Elusimicrobia bacterium]|nr:hypothetical protein [Elusimicrobiota bacterium]
MEKKKKTSLELSQGQAQRQDLRLFSALSSSEIDLLRQEAELLADPLFARLSRPAPDGGAPVLRRRLPGASYAFMSACGDEALAAAAGGAGAGEWLAERPAMLELARRVGQGNFEKYFLGGLPASPSAAKACGLTEGEFSSLKGFTDAFILAHERLRPEALPALYLRCAAVVSADRGRLSAAYTHPFYARGAYCIDRRALARMRRAGELSRSEAERASVLLSRAQRLSWRRAGFHRVLSVLLEAQAGFLLGKTGLLPLTQRQIAARTGLNPSTVSRLISSRTLMTPAGEEVRLSGLFLAKSHYIIDKIKAILGDGSATLTDSEIAAALRRSGIRVPRRSVNFYRSKTGR